MEPAAALSVKNASFEPVSLDPWADWRARIVCVASLLLHATVIALFFIREPGEDRYVEPPSIPVDLVVIPPPKPKVEPPPQPKPPEPPKPEVVHAESGGDPNLAPGQSPEAKPPEPLKKPSDAATSPKVEPKPTQTLPLPTPQPAPKATQAPAHAPQPPAKAAEPAPTPKPPAAPDTTPPQLAAVPPASKAAVPAPIHAPGQPNRESVPVRIDSRLRGEGGGDRYLNAMRDDIVSNLIYPSSGRGTAGVATYAMIVNRQGYLLELRLIRSSGSNALDRAGMDAIQNTAPFRPLPQNIRGESIGIEATLMIAPE